MDDGSTRQLHVLDPVKHLERQAGKAKRSIADICQAAVNSDWSLAQLSSILYSAVYGTVLQDLHLSAAPAGFEKELEHKTVKCTYVPGVVWNKAAMKIVNEVLDCARAALVEAAPRFPKKGGGRFLPKDTARALVWPADAMARAVSQAYGCSLVLLSKDTPGHMQMTAWFMVLHESSARGPMANLTAAYSHQHGIQDRSVDRMDFSTRNRKQLKRTFASWLCPHVLRNAAAVLKSSSSTHAAGMLREAQAMHHTATDAWAEFGEDSVGMKYLQSCLGLDNSRILGPSAMPATARSTWRGRDGRLILRWLTGRYPREGTMHHGGELSVQAEMIRAEAKHTDVPWAPTAAGRALWVEHVKAERVLTQDHGVDVDPLELAVVQDTLEQLQDRCRRAIRRL